MSKQIEVEHVDETIIFTINRKLEDIPDKARVEKPFLKAFEGEKGLIDAGIYFNVGDRLMLAECEEVPGYHSLDGGIEVLENESNIQFLAGAFRAIQPYQDYVVMHSLMHQLIEKTGSEETLRRLTKI